MREACWTCRNRTIQCDQSCFPCLKCKKAGLECRDKKPLRWVQGVAIRGRMRGYMYKETPTNRGALLSAHFRPKRDRRGSHQLQLTLQDPRMQNLDPLSRYYIDYYSQRICRLYILHDSDSNPFRGLLAYALEDVPLLRSIIALAARHLANTGYSFDQSYKNDVVVPTSRFTDTTLDALRFKTQAITALRKRLTRPHQEPVKTDTMMATILLFIFLELLESGLDGWNVHLKGARALVHLYQSLRGKTYSNCGSGEIGQEISTFITRQFSLIETLGASLSQSNPLIEDFCSTSYILSPGQESIVRSFLGCPEFILRSIQFFSSQRQLAAESPHNTAHAQDTLAMIEVTGNFNSLEWASGFKQQHSSPVSPYTAEIENLYMLGEAYKTAALLYGRQVLGPESATAESNELVLQLLGLIDALKTQDTLFKCLLWPTFFAGLHCLERDQQGLVHDCLKRIWDLTACLNAISASNILKDYWERTRLSGAQSHCVGLDRRWLLI
ncbi:Zn(II)2Cys6 transcription factor [Aspergillus foveolatus]|uniref:Zn(II)2Cys6 transcription factor n=1 Tax=Aspergillus foveolatus TaxID=210207 RepID=UPI003CCDB25C